jgi:hypothetical protein
MSLLRVVFLEFLICVHVLGAAVLFRRFFPRESPWLGFVVPITVLVTALNFLEHFIALPYLGWLLPFTLGGMIWCLVRPGYSWDGLRFPAVLFVITFTFLLLLKCISPDIPDYTEGAVDLTRVLNYSLGEKVPPTDSWMPPYDSGGYYSFQQYAASVLKRLFSVDIGTALNLSFALLLALLCQMGAAVAHSITGKKWISIIIVLVLLAGSTGSAPILMLLGHPDYGMSTDLDTSWDDPAKNPFSWILSRAPSHPGLTLVAPTYTIYCSEFHANLGATYLTMAILLAAYEAFRAGRFIWPWICLLTLPMVVIITSAWYFIIAALLGAGGLVVAGLAGRRPQSLKIVGIASAVGLVFVWPSFDSMAGNPFTQSFVWTPPDERIPLWMFLVQFWPVFIPWLFLFFIWDKLNWVSRWSHAFIALFFIGMEFVSLTERGFTSQKMWGDLYGLALITFLPLVFAQRNPFFRGLTILLTTTFIYCLGTWMGVCYYEPMDTSEFAALRGDAGILQDAQRKRILQVLSGLHAATILPGKCSWSYNLAPLIVTLSENRCFVAYTFQEEQYGHGGEINYRCKINNDFYSGAMTSPLPFLRSNNIAAVMIWPEDAIPDSILQQIQTEIGSEYFYIDCKMNEPNNAGVFMRQAGAPAEIPAIPSTNLDLAPHPNPLP